MIGITMNMFAVMVDPFLFSPAEPMAYEWSYIMIDKKRSLICMPEAL
jgi:hypothetical protein